MKTVLHINKLDDLDGALVVAGQESVDLVDDNGRIQMRGVPKDQAGRYGDLYMQIVIAVITDSNGKFLVHQRALTKKVDPGAIDHVCGGIQSDETPEAAAIRESIEETGVEPKNLQIIEQGLNSYGRYRYLVVGTGTTEPHVDNTRETIWTRYMSLDELRAKQASKEFTFVGEFFEDIAGALKAV
jgi:8-oxo-dGTP pyrophosphatase MutT (NUDIX family)